MSENFTRSNKDLEARIAQCTSSLDIANLLAEVPVTDVISPRPGAPERRPDYAPLRRDLRIGDRVFVLTAGSIFGLDIQERNLREDAKFWE